LKRPKNKHSANLTLIPAHGLTINVSYLYVAKRDDAYYNEMTWTTDNVKLDSYQKVDMNIRYSLNETLTITARGENLNNADYEDSYGYNTKGRSFYGGLELVL
jgi:vitamin B12 transporter